MTQEPSYLGQYPTPHRRNQSVRGEAILPPIPTWKNVTVQDKLVHTVGVRHPIQWTPSPQPPE